MITENGSKRGFHAIVIGGTGLVGGEIITALLANPNVEHVRSLGRRKTGKVHAKLEEHIIDFDQPDQWENLMQGDCLFSALGTTRSQAGSTQAQYVVDYTYQFRAAQAAVRNGVPNLVLISSIGADAESTFFYMKTKGALDRDVQALGFNAVHILRPGPLVGKREKARLGERIFAPILRMLAAIGLFRKYRPITGAQVATAALAVGMDMKPGNAVHEALELFELAGKGV